MKLFTTPAFSLLAEHHPVAVALPRYPEEIQLPQLGVQTFPRVKYVGGIHPEKFVHISAEQTVYDLHYRLCCVLASEPNAKMSALEFMQFSRVVCLDGRDCVEYAFQRLSNCKELPLRIQGREL